MQAFDIDLVYLWVDGNDPNWLEKKKRFTGKLADNSETDNKGRYVNNNELKFSLRSVEQYVPWIRRIYIVTDNQCPDWLRRDHPKIHIVDHTEILPKEALPCFNSSVIEYFLYKIPGLSEHFLFANDDMFFNKTLQPNYFFDKEGIPFVRLKKIFLGKWHYQIKRLFKKELGQYKSMVLEGALNVEQKLGKYYSGIPHHNVDAYVKSDYREAVEQIFWEQAEKSLSNHIRTRGDLHRSVFLYYALGTGKAHAKYVWRKDSLRLTIYRHNLKAHLKKYQPDLFCLNDDQRTKDEDREKITPFLEEIFPKKSAYEK